MHKQQDGYKAASTADVSSYCRLRPAPVQHALCPPTQYCSSVFHFRVGSCIMYRAHVCVSCVLSNILAPGCWKFKCFFCGRFSRETKE